MTPARLLRWTAIVLAAIAIADPQIPLPGRERPAIRVSTADPDVRDRLAAALTGAGFSIAADGESASIVTAGARMPAILAGTPMYVLREGAGAPDVSIVRASASATRVAEQAVAVSVTLHARGGGGRATTVRLEDGGLAVASTSHQWSAGEETWHAALSYLPDGARAVRLRVRADTLPGELRTADNVVDLLAPAMRGPVRALVVESGVTWPAAFVRRALEASPAFAVAAIQHATTAVATRAGSPPRALTRRELAPYEAVVIGQPQTLDDGALDAVRWFVDDRGGVAIVVPDRIVGGSIRGLAGIAFESRTLETPVALGGSGSGTLATELATPRALPPLAFTLASDPSGAPVVFGMRRGMGAVIVSGALDAWRYRDRNDGAFGRFWRSVILEHAGGVPPVVEVIATPALARPGDPVRVTARLRGTEWPADGDRLVIPPVTARAIDVSAGAEMPVRLWPSAEPGVYEGEWRPASRGGYAIDVSIGASNGGAAVTVADDVVAAGSDADVMAIAAHASGGAVAANETALVRALEERFPPRLATRPSRPARSPWYAAMFVLLLCGEWALRRRQGLA